MTQVLPLIHFNDVYRVTPQKISGLKGPIDVTQFAALLDSLREKWPELETGQPSGLVLFSGDVFSPSTESSVTRGSHMVPVMNELAPDVSLTGNHDFDFGYPHLCKLILASKFPWILSNIVDTDTGKTPEHLHRFQVFERAGIRIGVIGLVEEEWIATVSSWPPNFKYQSMADVGLELSKLLRDPQGEHKCDLIFALTHARVPNDIALCKDLSALPQDSVAEKHGVDAIFGGHDHMYYIGKGIQAWENYDASGEVLGAEGDDGVYLIKSGNDFRDLSSMELELADTPPGSVRRKIIKSIKGIHHVITPDLPSSGSLKQILSSLLSDVSASLKAPICKTLTEIDCKSAHVRIEESASGNYFADLLRHAYDDKLCIKGCGGADGVLICGGTLRGDSTYGPGLVTLGDIMEILPFEDPIVVIETDGPTLYQSLENALGTWPAQEGRFPIVSGFRVEWDSRKPAGSRVVGIWLEQTHSDDEIDPNEGDESRPTIHRHESDIPAQRKSKGEQVSREPGGRKYVVVTREYMAAGHDGYEPLKGSRYLVDDEQGVIMSTIVRKYILGLQYIKHIKHLTAQRKASTDSSTDAGARARMRWKDTARRIVSVSARHNKDRIHSALQTAATKNMSEVDCFDGGRARSGGSREGAKAQGAMFDENSLVVIAPVVDGRLKNFGRE